MDDDTSAIGLIIDVAAAGLLAVSAGWSGAVLGDWTVAVFASAAALGVGLAILHLAGRAGGRFRLPDFGLVAWKDEGEFPRDEEKVVALFPGLALPTPGEMQQRIEQHLKGRGACSTTTDAADVVLLGADASAALRNALGELKRSLR